MICGFGGSTLGVDGCEKCFDSGKGDGLWEDNRLAEAGAYFGKWVALDNVFVFTIVKKSLEGSDFPLGSFRFVCCVKTADVRFNY